MDSKVNFAKIGFFILTLFILLLIFIFWLGKYGLEDKKYDYYTLYFSESVSGLNVESPIKYKGLEVGNVKNIKINPSNSEEIEITISVNAGTPIKQDVKAVLGTLGITGLKYIELEGGDKESALLEENSKGKKIIPTRPSFISTLQLSSKEFEKILLQATKLLSDENLINISEILKSSNQSLKNIEHFTNYLVQQEDSLANLINDFSNFATISQDSFKVMSNSASTVKTSAANFQLLSQRLIQEVERGSFDLKDISKESINNLNEVLQNLNNTLIQAQTLIEKFENSPSDIIFKQQPVEYGPGE